MRVLDFLGLSSASYEVEIPVEMREAVTAQGTLAPRISRNEALQVPAVKRARDLIAGTLSSLPIHIRDKDREISTPTSLLEQINPDQPNIIVFALTFEDLLFEAISWWRVTAQNSQGFPMSAEHVAPSRVSIFDGRAYIDGMPVDDRAVIRFDSPNPPLLVHAARAIRTCLTLDRAAGRYADEPIPLGYFTPREGIKRDGTEEQINGILDKWAISRANRAYGYVGAALELKQLQFNAEQIQLAEQRQHAVLEIARAAGVDPEDLGVSTTSRTYQNSEQRRQDLLDFTLGPYMKAVEQRLSMGDVTPRGHRVKFNLDGFLRSDTLGRMNAYKLGLEVGAYVDEEIRELEDRPAVRVRRVSSPSELVPVTQVPEGSPNGNG